MRLSSRVGTYELIEADEEQLVGIFGRARQGIFHGLNITMPLKEVASRHVDRLDSLAYAAGSVNTVVVDGTTLVGYSSDAVAFGRLWIDDSLFGQRTIHLLGTGGSARAAAVSLPEGTTLYVSARRNASAAALADEFGGQVVRWGAAVAGATVVNCTPLGMKRERLPDEVIRAAGALIDLPYGADVTPAVALSFRLGKPVVDGLTFLVRQAVESYRLWTGLSVRLDDVLSALRFS